MTFNQENQQTPHRDRGEGPTVEFQESACRGRGSLSGEVALQQPPHTPSHLLWGSDLQQLLKEGAPDFPDLSLPSRSGLENELPGTLRGSKAVWVVLEVCKARALFVVGTPVPHTHPSPHALCPHNPQDSPCQRRTVEEEQAGAEFKFCYYHCVASCANS